jgi:transposase
MLRQMERSAIHLLHKRGQSQREIARALGHSRTTVARALTEPVDRRPTRRRRRSKLDPYRPRLEQWVREGLTGVRMLELAREDPEWDYPGSRSHFRAYVRRVRQALSQAQAAADVPVRFEGLPGEYLQVDWGEVRAFPFAQQPPATRYFLACRLKYSRWTWVRFTAEMRQETLFRGLVDCLCALGWVPWVLVFDNMRTVTTGRDAQRQPVWHPALLQLAAEFGFHPEACTPGAGNQKGSVESLVKWVKGNFLAGRDFADDADLAAQCGAWLEYANARPSQATDVPPQARLAEEAAKGGPLPATAAGGDYGFLHPGRVTAEALVAVLGNQYSVPVPHVGAPVAARVHRERVALWRDTLRLAEHARAPDGAHRRVVDPAHFAPLFARKPRAQVMLYREALLQLGGDAPWYVSELSRRRRAQLREEVLGVYALYERYGGPRLLQAMAFATTRSAYGAEYLAALLAYEGHLPGWSDAPAWTAAPTPAAPARLALGVAGPPQDEIDRQLSLYEAYVRTDHPDGTDAGRPTGDEADGVAGAEAAR